MTEEKRDITFLSHQSNGPVSAGATAMIIARSQLPLLEPYKLYIPAWIANYFVIDDVRVGNRSMFPAAQSVVADQYANGDGHEFKCEPIHVGQDFLMIVTNVSGVCRSFRASWACYLPKKMPALEEQPSFWSHIPGPIDLLNRARDIKDAVQEKVQEFKDKVEAKIQPRRSLPKPKDPPGFGWDPGYGDD